MAWKNTFSKLHARTAIPAGIIAAAFFNGILGLTVYFRIITNAAEDRDLLYPIIIGILVIILLALLVGNAVNWSGQQLFAGTIVINFPSALVGLYYLIPMLELDARWDPSMAASGWDPLGTVPGIIVSMSFIGFQCLSIALSLVLLRKIITARATALDAHPSMMGFFKTKPLHPGARSDLLVTGMVLVASSAVALVSGGANAKYYLLLSCFFQLLEVASFPAFKEGLAPGHDMEARRRADELGLKSRPRAGVPGRVASLSGYLLIFLLAITQFVQKNDQGNDLEVMVASIPYLCLGIATWMVSSWILGIAGFNSHAWRYFVALALMAIPWAIAFSDEARQFTAFREPAAWFCAGVAVGLSTCGIWDLLWPLPRWNARRAASTFTSIVLLVSAFANGFVNLFINTPRDDVYLIIYLSVIGLVAVLGIVASLLLWNATKRK